MHTSLIDAITLNRQNVEIYTRALSPMSSASSPDRGRCVPNTSQTVRSLWKRAFPSWSVRFAYTACNRTWAKLVCRNSPSVHVLLAFKLFLGGIKSVRMLPFCIFMLQTTPIWLHLWCQACPMCQASRVVFPVPYWGALMGNGRDVKPRAK